jgi:LmbE family N-acetylglucosaminyl deacetylase
MTGIGGGEEMDAIAERVRRNRVVVISPHLDDAVLSAWLVLAGARSARVITCFAGAPAGPVRGRWDERTGTVSAAAALAGRRAEDMRALALTDSEPVHLDLLDEQYREGRNAPLACLVQSLRDHLADAAEIWLPAALGAHPDHVAARDAALAAARQGQRVRVYADLPYAGQPGWPIDVTHAPRDLAVECYSLLRGRPGPARQWRSTLDGAGVRVDSGHRCVRKLTRSQFRRKRHAVHQYSSQLDALRCGPRHPLRERRLFAYEVHWALYD